MAPPTAAATVDDLLWQLAALEKARDAVSRNAGDREVTGSVIELARSLGSVHPETGSIRAIRAVLDKLEHPAQFRRDQDAWEKHSASKRTFKTWKGGIHRILDTAFAALSPDELTDVALSLTDDFPNDLRLEDPPAYTSSDGVASDVPSEGTQSPVFGAAGPALTSHCTMSMSIPPPSETFSKGEPPEPLSVSDDALQTHAAKLDGEEGGQLPRAELRAMAQRDDVRAAAEGLLAAHAAAYVQRAGEGASFAGWVSSLHPGASTRLDPRLAQQPEGRHLDIWRAALAAAQAQAALQPSRSDSAGTHTATVSFEAGAADGGGVGGGSSGGTSIETELQNGWGGWQAHSGLADGVAYGFFYVHMVAMTAGLAAARSLVAFVSHGAWRAGRALERARRYEGSGGSRALPAPVLVFLGILGATLVLVAAVLTASEMALAAAELGMGLAMQAACGATCALLSLSAERGMAARRRLGGCAAWVHPLCRVSPPAQRIGVVCLGLDNVGRAAQAGLPRRARLADEADGEAESVPPQSPGWVTRTNERARWLGMAAQAWAEPKEQPRQLPSASPIPGGRMARMRSLDWMEAGGMEPADEGGRRVDHSPETEQPPTVLGIPLGPEGSERV